MSLILIGSRAICFRNSNLLTARPTQWRKPKDFDFISTEDAAIDWLDKHNITNFKKEDGKIIANENETPCEFEIIQSGKSSELFSQLVQNDSKTLKTDFGLIPNLDLLFTLKDTHKYKKFHNSPHRFYKHCIDWHSLKNIGAKVKIEYEEFKKLREKETYTNILPKLNMSKQNFFDENKNGVKQIYIHDDIHRAICLYDVPAYTLYLKNGSDVLTDNKKFFSLPENIRLAGIIEEGLTLAIERSLVIFPGKMTPSAAFIFAIAKVATSITGGKFREYAFLNIFKALQKYPKNYWEIFQSAINNGKVRKISQ